MASCPHGVSFSKLEIRPSLFVVLPPDRPKAKILLCTEGGENFFLMVSHCRVQTKEDCCHRLRLFHEAQCTTVHLCGDCGPVPVCVFQATTLTQHPTPPPLPRPLEQGTRHSKQVAYLLTVKIFGKVSWLTSFSAAV